MQENIVGAIYLAALAGVCVLAHVFIRRYVLAVIAPAILVPALAIGVDYLVNGYMDPFTPIAIPFGFVATLVISSLIGLPFRRKRMRDKPKDVDKEEDWPWKEQSPQK